MSDIRYGGGWGHGDPRSNRTARLVAEAQRRDNWYAQRDAEDARERAARAAVFEENSIRASAEAAYDRGDDVDLRRVWADGGIGRTHAEVLAEASARMDLEDAREARRRATSGMTDEAWSDTYSVDMSAPDRTSDEAQARAALLRALAARDRRREPERERRRTREQIDGTAKRLMGAIENVAVYVLENDERRFGR